jgi:L,D-transpeptidase catalytic domain
MKRFVFLFAGGLLALTPAQKAEAAVTANVSLAKQRMEVVVDGALTHTWPVSTGRDEFETPAGTYTTQWLDKDHKSQKYDDAPMPYSVFFRGGYAVHGTNAVSMLGRRASHGCVRLSTPNARRFFELVQQHGVSASKVVIHDAPAKRADKLYVAEIGSKRERAAASQKPAQKRVPTTALARSYAPTPGYSAPGYAQPVMVYQIGADGRMIPATYRRY